MKNLCRILFLLAIAIFTGCKNAAQSGEAQKSEAERLADMQPISFDANNPCEAIVGTWRTEPQEPAGENAPHCDTHHPKFLIVLKIGKENGEWMEKYLYSGREAGCVNCEKCQDAIYKQGTVTTIETVDNEKCGEENIVAKVTASVRDDKTSGQKDRIRGFAFDAEKKEMHLFKLEGETWKKESDSNNVFYKIAN